MHAHDEVAGSAEAMRDAGAKFDGLLQVTLEGCRALEPAAWQRVIQASGIPGLRMACSLQHACVFKAFNMGDAVHVPRAPACVHARR